MAEDPSPSSSAKNKPTTIFIPPRGPMDSLFTNGLSGVGFSPGPMTLVSSYFAEQSSFSFSQLLAMASPKPGGFLLDPSKSSNNGGNNVDLGSEGDRSESIGEKSEGYKKNRPENLVVNQSPQMQIEGLNQLFTGLSPVGLIAPPGFLSPLQSPFGMSHQQALAHVTAQAALSQSSVFVQMQAELQGSSTSKPETSTQQVTDQTPPKPESSKIDSPEYSESDKKIKTSTSVSGKKPASDGYNWRKYGQKHVKGSECPRSYYKCTHPNCPVKKKIERSGDGRVSEIIYKGHHNHDPPQSNSNKRRALDKTNKFDIPGTVSHAQMEDGINGFSDEIDPSNSIKRLPEHRMSAGNNDEGEVSEIVVDGEGDDGDEPIAKRRSIEMGPTITSHQTVTESKIVVRTRTEVDLLDDGFRWRKYGQKVVKGNPYPRSYYRCTYAGCTVRKHVERSSADPKEVVTTYEGKHSHEIPMGKYQGATNANYAQQQSKTRKNVGKKSSPVSGEADFEKKDQMPTTLQLKQEHVAA